MAKEQGSLGLRWGGHFSPTESFGPPGTRPEMGKGQTLQGWVGCSPEPQLPAAAGRGLPLTLPLQAAPQGEEQGHCFGACGSVMVWPSTVSFRSEGFLSQ